MPPGYNDIELTEKFVREISLIDTHEQARGSSYISSFACPESCRC
jgi:hypothetical protein